MPFQGPGIYEIVPYQVPKLNANCYGGGMESGQEVRTYQRGDKPSDNALWQMAIAKGDGENAEYLILNVRNGYYLQATDEQKITHVNQASPRDPTVRWTVKKAFTHGYDVWTINSVSGRGQLNVEGGSLDPDAAIIMWSYDNTDNAKWYFDPRE